MPRKRVHAISDKGVRAMCSPNETTEPHADARSTAPPHPPHVPGWRQHLGSILFLLTLIAAAVGANRLAVWANASLRKPVPVPSSKQFPTVDLGVFDQREKLHIEVDFRPLLRDPDARGNLSIKAVRGECRFDFRADRAHDGDTGSGVVATLELSTSELSEVYYDRFHYRIEIPVELANEGSVVGRGSLWLTVRKPLTTQYPSVHFGRACRPNMPANPRTIWIRTAVGVDEIVVTSDNDAVTTVVRKREPTQYDLTVYPRTDRAPGSYHANLKLTARTPDGQTRFGGMLPVGFELREPD